ncbi:hypothetical protein BOS5A_220049 [Bosea sp. EC-HK365B]|nr:hypothetical protein BOSE7B_40138 [Bosea sp. 7B]CAD5290285.1 hypothetical protein BOSE21B_60014 [Bosea sp. 21B]VVT60704.1 hypothetical protein BOS5A_220049 [Bosea sp. EC-HK365B]VXB54259.1 hypothetical protein BOSE127_130048 [Bosea sp. 127]
MRRLPIDTGPTGQLDLLGWRDREPHWEFVMNWTSPPHPGGTRPFLMAALATSQRHGDPSWHSRRTPH